MFEYQKNHRNTIAYQRYPGTTKLNTNSDISKRISDENYLEKHVYSSLYILFKNRISYSCNPSKLLKLNKMLKRTSLISQTTLPKYTCPKIVGLQDIMRGGRRTCHA